MFKTKIVNLRSQDRESEQHEINDGNVQVSNCDFYMTKPISIKRGGSIGMRSAFMPITFKNVDSTNDRFIIKFFNDTTAGDNDHVSITFQMKHGYYNSQSDVRTEVNRLLGLLNATMATSINANEGGVAYTYANGATTETLLSADMTCALSTDDNTRNHLVFTLPDSVVFASTSVHKDSGTDIASTKIESFAIMFGENTTGLTTNFSVSGRTAHQILGYGRELTKPQSTGGVDFALSDSVADDDRGGSDTDALSRTADKLVNLSRTNYIYVRSNLCREARESRKRGNPTNLLAKIPVSNITYGGTMYYEPDDGSTLKFTLDEGDIFNINIRLTDDNDVELDFDETDWEMVLCFMGEFI